MARYFAQLNENNIVEQVIVADTKTWVNQNMEGFWVETFINSRTKEYAGIGYTYDPIQKDFYPPQPFPSWTLDADLVWQPPKPMPEIKEGFSRVWNEQLLDWEYLQII